MKDKYDDAILKAFEATYSAAVDVGLNDYGSTLHKQLELASQALRIAYIISAERPRD